MKKLFAAILITIFFNKNTDKNRNSHFDVKLTDFKSHKKSNIFQPKAAPQKIEVQQQLSGTKKIFHTHISRNEAISLHARSSKETNNYIV